MRSWSPELHSGGKQENLRVGQGVDRLHRGTFQTTTRVVKEACRSQSDTGAERIRGGQRLQRVGQHRGGRFGSSSDVSWDADVKISGPLGSLAKPLVQGNIKKIVEQLFECVKSKLSQT